MARGVELGVAYLTLAAETRGLVSSIAKGLQQGEKIAGQSGERIGQAIKKGVDKSKPIDTKALTDQVERDQQRLAAAVQQSARKQEDATRKVEIAHQRLKEVREKGNATTSQVMRAEEQFRQAINRSKDAAANARAQQELYAGAVSNSKKELFDAEKHNRQLQRTIDEASREAALAAERYKGFGGSVRKAMDEAKSAISGSFGGAFAQARADVDQTESKFTGFTGSVQRNASIAAGTVKNTLSGALTQARTDVDQTEQKFDGLTGSIRRNMSIAAGTVKNSFTGAFYKSEAEGRNAAKNISSEFDKSAEESSRGFTTKFSGAFKGLIGAASAAGLSMGAAITKGITDNLQQGDTKAKMAASLGLSGDSALNAGQVTGELFKQGFGESYDDVARGVSAVISSIPGIANSEELQDITKNILAMSDAMGIDATESAGALTTMLSSGLAKNGTEATQLLAAGLQRIPEQFRGEAVDALVEYSDEFTALGYTGEEAMTMLVRGAQKGQYGIDKTADAIKEFQIQATSGSTASTEAFQAIGLNATEMSNKILAGGDSAKEARNQIVDALLGVKDPSAQAQAAIALFGTPLEDMNVTEIPQFLQSMQNASGGMGDFQGAAQQMTDQLQNSDMNKLESFKRTLQQGWTDAVGGLVSALVNVAEAFMPVRQFILDTKDQWMPFAIGIGLVATAVGIYAASGWIAAAATAALGGALAILTSPITLIIAGIGLLVGAVIYAYQNFEWFRNGVNFVWEWIKSVIAGFVDWWTQVAFPAILTGLQWVGDKFVWLYQNVVLPVWGWITSVISGFVDWLTITAIPWVSGALQTLGGWFSWLNDVIIQPVWYAIRVTIAAVVAVILTIFQGLAWVVTNVLAPPFVWLWQNVISPVFSWIWDKISGFGGWFSTTAVPQITGAVDWLKNAFQWLWDKVSAVWTWIRDKVQQFATWFIAALLPYITAGLDLLKLAFHWLWDKVSAVFSWIWDKIQRFATWFVVQILPYIMGALDLLKAAFHWLWDKVSAVWSWISDKISRTWNWIRDVVLSPAINWLKSIFGPAWDWMSDKIGRVWDWVGDKISRTWNWIRDNVLTPMERFLNENVVDAFRRAKDGIGRVWDEIKTKVSAPVEKVINVVINDGFISNYNKVAKKFGVDPLEPVHFNGLATGGIVGQGYARGGILPGYQPKKKDELLTPMRKGEGVLVPEAVRALGADFIHGVNGAANSGGIRGAQEWKKKHGVAAGDGHDHGAPAGAYGWAGSSFKTSGATPPSGGSGIWGSFQASASRAGAMSFPDKNFMGVSTKRAAQAWMGRSALNVNTEGKGPSVSVGYGNHGPWGFNSGSSVQVNPSAPGNMVLSILMHEFGHALSLDHTNNGASIMHPAIAGVKSPSGSDYAALRSAWGKPGEGVKTYDVNGGDGGSSFRDILQPLWDSTVGKLMDGVLGKFAEEFKGNHVVQLGTSAVKKIIKGGFDFLLGHGEDSGSEGGSSKDWTGTVKQALSRAGLPVRDDYINAWLKQIQTESGGNPRAVQNGYVDANTGGNEAAGLVQVAKSTWDAYRDKSLPNDRFNPLASLMAGMNWAKARYGTSGMLGVIGHGHGYNMGGIVDHLRPTLFDGGGWLTQGTSVVQHNPKKPDAVLSNADWRTMYKIAEESGNNRAAQGNNIQVVVPEREGIAPDTLGRRVGEGINHKLRKAGIR